MDNLVIEVGKYYKTRDGHKIRIYAIDGHSHYSIHGAVLWDDGWEVIGWTQEGFYYWEEGESGVDIVSEWTEPHPAESWEVDKKILISVDEERWHKGYFSHFKNGLFYTFAYGKTSWTQQGVIGYKYAKPVEEE